jgi:hypothetical protein
MYQGSATRYGIRIPDPAWALAAAGEHASPNVTERVYEPSVASCVAVICHQLVVQFRLIDGVAVMNKLDGAEITPAWEPAGWWKEFSRPSGPGRSSGYARAASPST